MRHYPLSTLSQSYSGHSDVAPAPADMDYDPDNFPEPPISTKFSRSFAILDTSSADVPHETEPSQEIDLSTEKTSSSPNQSKEEITSNHSENDAENEKMTNETADGQEISGNVTRAAHEELIIAEKQIEDSDVSSKVAESVIEEGDQREPQEVTHEVSHIAKVVRQTSQENVINDESSDDVSGVTLVERTDEDFVEISRKRVTSETIVRENILVLFEPKQSTGNDSLAADQSASCITEISIPAVPQKDMDISEWGRVLDTIFSKSLLELASKHGVQEGV